MKLKLASPRRKRLLAAVAVSAVLGMTAAALAGPPSTWKSGDVLTADALNQNFTDLDKRLSAVEAQSHPPSGFQASLAAAAVIGSATLVDIAFDEVEFDLANEYDPATGVFAPNLPGTYLLVCHFEFNSTSASGEWSSFLMKNGVQVGVGELYAQGLGVTPSTTSIVELAAGDAVKCTVRQSSGTDQTMFATAGRNSFSAARLY